MRQYIQNGVCQSSNHYRCYRQSPHTCLYRIRLQVTSQLHLLPSAECAHDRQSALFLYLHSNWCSPKQLPIKLPKHSFFRCRFCLSALSAIRQKKKLQQAFLLIYNFLFQYLSVPCTTIPLALQFAVLVFFVYCVSVSSFFSSFKASINLWTLVKEFQSQKG